MMGYFLVAVWMLILVFLGWWMFGDRTSTRLPSEIEEELRRLRGEVDRLSTDVDRLLEEQSFLVKMLTDEERLRLPRRREADLPADPSRARPDEPEV